MDYGEKYCFEYNDRVVEGMYIRTVQWEDSEAYYYMQLTNGDRVNIPASTHVQPVSDGYYYPGGDCQI